MSYILDAIFDDLVIYVWINPLDDSDDGSVIIRAKDFNNIQDFNDNCTYDGSVPTSFDEFKSKLKEVGIEYYDVSESMYYHIYTE